MLKVKPQHLLETIGLATPTQQGLSTVLSLGRSITSEIISPTGSTGSIGFYEKDKQSSATIRDVWMTNFFGELEKLSSLVDQGYNIISFVSLTTRIIVL